jgi:hypothetical protein
MYGTLLQALIDEFNLQKTYLGIKQVELGVNIDSGIFPITIKPCLIMQIPQSNPSLFVGGFNRESKDLHVTIVFEDSKIDYNTADQDVIDRELKNYTIADRVQNLFNKELFLSNLMKNLVNYNNLHTKARGYNKSKLLYSENIALIVYDINIAVMLSEDMIIPKIEIENTEQTLLINS